MRNIIVVDCISTGKNFVEDIINRGYNPILLDLKVADTKDGRDFAEFVIENYKSIKHEYEMIYEMDTYEETLEMVKEYDPLLIVAGYERGVPLATKLSEDLGLLGNSVENLEAMTDKAKMQERIAEHGLRSLKGKVVENFKEAMAFYDNEGLEEVVIKPNYNAGSTNIRFCSNRNEMIGEITNILDSINPYENMVDKLLIQEKVDGVEYVVNTVSHNGIPRVTLVWKFNKVKNSQGDEIYESCETVNELGLGEAEVVEYAYDVVKALGVQYGSVSGKYIMDEDGPVLIEANCCPSGGNMPADFLDIISGQHETDSILDSYLKPERFYEELKRKYELYAYGIQKFFIVPNNMIARSSPMVSISSRLKAYYSTSLNTINLGGIFYQKTKDVNSSAGVVFLVHKDSSEIESNLNFLRAVERNAFSLILSDDSLEAPEIDDEKYLNDIKPLVSESEKYGTCLFVTDQFVDDISILQINHEQIGDVGGKFDSIIINLNKSLIDKSEEEKVNIVLNIFSKLRTGGMIFIPKNTYQFAMSGRKGMEALLKVLDYKIELPPYNIKEVIIASKAK